MLGSIIPINFFERCFLRIRTSLDITALPEFKLSYGGDKNLFGYP